MPLSTCSSSGCTQEQKSIVIDANWRWIHDSGSTNCYKGTEWNPTLCPDPTTCSTNCIVEGNTLDKYSSTYGIQASGDGVKLGFVTQTAYGANYGSRVYLLDDDSTYKSFKLKNREFTFTVDVSSMPCGLNGAVYFVEMDADGGMAKSGGLNKAGAGFGTGYCDAQCPHDIKFINGQANVLNWNSTSDPPVGHYGTCCIEMDIWEANSRATAYTPHTCSIKGQYRCEGTECGDGASNQRYDGVCDKDGCDFNNYRMGDETFFGRGSNFELDSTQPLTVVTQFITSDGTDAGDLVEIRRFYVQNGKVVQNPDSKIAGVQGSSVTDQYCSEEKKVFGDINDFQRKGGLKGMGEALDRGMVLVMSIWDDSTANMLWLDSTYPLSSKPSAPGVLRGPCKTSTGSPAYVRSRYPQASVTYSDIRVGSLNTTLCPVSTVASGGAGSDPFGGDRRLQACAVSGAPSGGAGGDPFGGDRRLEDDMHI